MPRKLRRESQTGYHHLMVRGINKGALFHNRDDYHYFLHLAYDYTKILKIAIYHYCLMTNHVHMLVQTPDTPTLSLFSHFVQRKYAYYYSKVYEPGLIKVFHGRFQSIPIERDDYLLECGRYIERNPLKAKMVQNPGDYPFSSYRHYVYGE